MQRTSIGTAFALVTKSTRSASAPKAEGHRSWRYLRKGTNSGLTHSDTHGDYSITLSAATIRRAPLPKIIDGKVLVGAAVLMYARAIMLVAGGESRMFVGHDHSDGDRNDIRAAEFCACWVSSDPSVFEDGPRRCWQLHERKHQVEALAAALLQEGSLDAAEIAAILSGRPDVTRRSRWNANIVNAESFSRTFGTLTRNPIPM